MHAAVVHGQVQRAGRREVATEEEEPSIGVPEHEGEVAVELEQPFDAEGAVGGGDQSAAGASAATGWPAARSADASGRPIVQRRVGGHVHTAARGDQRDPTQPRTPLPVITLHAQRDAIVVAAPDVDAGARALPQRHPSAGSLYAGGATALRRMAESDVMLGSTIGELGRADAQAATASSRRSSPSATTSSNQRQVGAELVGGHLGKTAAKPRRSGSNSIPSGGNEFPDAGAGLVQPEVVLVARRVQHRPVGEALEDDAGFRLISVAHGCHRQGGSNRGDS